MVGRGIRVAGVVAVATLAAVWARAQGPANDFRPDSTFSGSTLAGWHTLGASQWKAQNGELTGIASGAGGGWLVLDESYQDLNFFARFRCQPVGRRLAVLGGRLQQGRRDGHHHVERTRNIHFLGSEVKIDYRFSPSEV